MTITGDFSTGYRCGQETSRDEGVDNPWTSGNMTDVGGDGWGVDVAVPQWEWQIPLGDYTVRPTGKGQFQPTNIKKKEKKKEFKKVIESMYVIYIFLLFSGFYLAGRYFSLLIRTFLISAARMSWYLQHLWFHGCNDLFLEGWMITLLSI